MRITSVYGITRYFSVILIYNKMMKQFKTDEYTKMFIYWVMSTLHLNRSLLLKCC